MTNIEHCVTRRPLAWHETDLQQTHELGAPRSTVEQTSIARARGGRAESLS